MEGQSYGEYQNNEEDTDVQKGPWTMEEDSLLSEYVAVHGEGRWNAAARCAGLKRTGKSCRLRWLNYLRPDVRRGNISLQEQLLILELHSRWGNRWSKIAQHLPGRTDNEIKNYWRTRVQKLAKQLKCDVNSNQFRDALRYVWIPRLMERIKVASSSGSSSGQPANSPNTNIATCFLSNPTAREINTGSGSNVLEWIDQTVIMDFSPEFFDTQVSPISDLADYPNSHQSDGSHPKSIPNGLISYPVESGPTYWDWWSVFGVEDSSVIDESWWTESDHENIIWNF